MIKLSLCMVVKNVAQSLGRCLASVYSIVDEIVLVDQGSSDDTVAVAQEWGAKIVPYQETMDSGVSRNLCLELARGEWILFIEANEELVASEKEITKLMNIKQVDGYSFQIIDWIHEDPKYSLLNSSPTVRLFRKKAQYEFDGMRYEGIKQAIIAHKGVKGIADSNLSLIRYQHLPSNPRPIFSKAQSQNPYQQFQLGMQSFQNNEFAGALQYFLQAKGNPNVAKIWCQQLDFQIVLCLIQLGRWSEAEALLKQSVDEQLQATKLFLKGYLAIVTKEWGTAVQRLTHGVQLLRKQPELSQNIASYGFYYLLGEAQLGLNRPWAALVALSLALENQPLFIAALVKITRILNQSAEVPQSVTQRLVSFADPVVQISLSRRLLQAGEQSAAMLASLGAIYQLAGGYGGRLHKCQAVWPHACATLLNSLVEPDDQPSELFNRAHQLQLKTAGSLITGLPERLLPQLPWLDQWRQELVLLVIKEMQQKGTVGMDEST